MLFTVETKDTFMYECAELEIDWAERDKGETSVETEAVNYCEVI